MKLTFRKWVVKPPPRARGLTLIELLAAMTIITIVVCVITSSIQKNFGSQFAINWSYVGITIITLVVLLVFGCGIHACIQRWGTGYRLRSRRFR